jgi:hypothetical protein
MLSEERDDLRAFVRDELPPGDAAVVIRGGPDTPSLLRSHARRVNRLFVLDGADVYGISVFVASSDIGVASERQILRGKLSTYESIYRTTVGELIAAGFGLLPTFQAPHYTVLVADLDTVDELAAALGPMLTNPYAGGRKEER